MKTFDYAGKSWEYDDCTLFIVEMGRYHNSYSYSQQFMKWKQAIETYEAMNVSDGYKKRLSIVRNGVKTKITHKTSKGVPK